MKSIIHLILLIVATSAMAQSFEGTIKWKMTMEFSDPEKAAKMKEAAQQMNDPDMQAKMAELKKQMENPQMKALMESNPQMKAMMDKMTSGSFTDANSMMPSGVTIKTKDGNSLSLIEGGITDGMETLYRKDKNQSYQLDRANKTFSVINPGSASNQANVKVTKTSETMMVMNYSCTKYLIEMSSGDITSTQICWATTDIKDLDLKSLANQKTGKGSAMFYSEIDGVPLKMEMQSPDGKMIMEVIDISRGGLNANDFNIPKDFKEVKGMFSGN